MTVWCKDDLPIDMAGQKTVTVPSFNPRCGPTPTTTSTVGADICGGQIPPPATTTVTSDFFCVAGKPYHFDVIPTAGLEATLMTLARTDTGSLYDTEDGGLPTTTILKDDIDARTPAPAAEASPRSS